MKKALFTIATLCLILCFAIQIQAAQKDKKKTPAKAKPAEPTLVTEDGKPLNIAAEIEAGTLPLTASEAKEIAEAVEGFNRISKELQQRQLMLLQIPLENIPDIIAAVGNIKNAAERLNNADERILRLRDKHRTAHGCSTCEYSKDIQFLVKPKAQP